MSQRLPVRGTSLSEQVLEILAERIKDGVYPTRSQIPPEHQLANEFNVSRATIRSAIGVLAERGLVVRRHGVGTFVSQLSYLKNPLNEAVDFTCLIANQGAKPGVQHLGISLIEPRPDIAKALQIEPSQSVLRSYKIFTANEAPLVYCVSIMPTWVLNSKLIEKVVRQPELIEPLYDFLEQRCNQRVEYHIAKVWAEIAKNCEFPELPLTPFTPVLALEEVGHNADETPLWYSIAYFPGNSMSFEMVRYRVQKR